MYTTFLKSDFALNDSMQSNAFGMVCCLTTERTKNCAKSTNDIYFSQRRKGSPWT